MTDIKISKSRSEGKGGFAYLKKLDTISTQFDLKGSATTSCYIDNVSS